MTHNRKPWTQDGHPGIKLATDGWLGAMASAVALLSYSAERLQPGMSGMIRVFWVHSEAPYNLSQSRSEPGFAHAPGEGIV